jgi:hypothetical protein
MQRGGEKGEGGKRFVFIQDRPREKRPTRGRREDRRRVTERRGPRSGSLKRSGGTAVM